MLSIYNFLSFIALILYLPWLVFKKGPESKSTFISERLGLSEYSKTDIWVHAVSVGEVLASLPFLKKLKSEFPDKKIILSTTTYTGQKVARDKFPEAERIMYVPVDTGICVKKAVKTLRPEVFITVETEIWPMLFSSLKELGSRIVILNGRISKKSFRGYRKIKFLMKTVFSYVDYLYMQSKDDAERIIEIGADREKVGIMGNFKFDIDLSRSSPPSWAIKPDRRIFLAASTHRGEDEIILDAFRNIKINFKDLQLIIAPRHPERFNEVAEIIKMKGVSYARRSEIIEAENTEGVDAILLDSIGELSGVFSVADVAFVGGSLVPEGGHNIMEPAYWSKPIIFGPHMDNFPVANKFLERSAAQTVRDSGEIGTAVSELLSNQEKSSDMGKNAKSILDENTGAVNKAIELIRGYIGTA